MRNSERGPDRLGATCGSSKLARTSPQNDGLRAFNQVSPGLELERAPQRRKGRRPSGSKGGGSRSRQ